MESYLPPLIILIATAVLLFGRWLYYSSRQRAPWYTDMCIVIAIIALAALLELGMERTPAYKYGTVRLWSGDIYSNQNSQQIADPYTFTHIIHGFGFYALTWFIPAPLSLGARAIIAVSAESVWEVFENTDMVINRYREETISLDYYGDSIINSVFDILACVLGFFFAARFPTKATILFALFIEVGLALWIQDSLFLNILMLIYPIQAIKTWQMRG